MLLVLSDIPLRTGSFALENQWLLWSEARLYADRLVLSGWGLWERYWRQVSLDEIEQVETKTEECLCLQLENGTDVSLLLSETDGWARSIRVHREMYARRE